jgi:hypothetical protein
MTAPFWIVSASWLVALLGVTLWVVVGAKPQPRDGGRLPAEHGYCEFCPRQGECSVCGSSHP